MPKELWMNLSSFTRLGENRKKLSSIESLRRVSKMSSEDFHQLTSLIITMTKRNFGLDPIVWRDHLAKAEWGRSILRCALMRNLSNMLRSKLSVKGRDSKEIIARFRRERQILAALDQLI